MPTLIGWAGTDNLIGGAGDDFIVGGPGPDRLVGGGGADRFRFNSWRDARSESPDVIVDFVTGVDVIDLSSIPAIGLIRILHGIDGWMVVATTPTGLLRINSYERVTPADLRVAPGVPIETFVVETSNFNGSPRIDTLAPPLGSTHYRPGRDYVAGRPGNDTISGSDASPSSNVAAVDILDGAAGDDTISAGSGDWAYGGDGADTLSVLSDGGQGTTYLVGGAGADRFVMGGGTQPVRVLDFTTSGPDADMLVLERGYRPLEFADGVQYGNFFLVGVTLSEMTGRVLGPPGPVYPSGLITTISGLIYAQTPSGFRYHGVTAADHIDYSQSTTALDFFSDWSSGGTASYVYARYPSGTLDDLIGIEMITGTDFADSMVSEGRITLSGGAGNDRLIAYRFRGDSNVILYGGTGDDQLAGNGDDVLYGDEGHDWLQGGDRSDRLYGGEGNDLLDPGTGSDQVDGGDGFDGVVYTGAHSAYQIVTSNGVTRVTTTINGVQETDTLVAVETIRFSDQTITLDPAVYVYSAAGEILRGTVLGDVLIGGGGADTIISGEGWDVIRYLATPDSQAGEARDTLVDFATGIDRIDLTAINPTSISVVLVAEGTLVRGVVFAETPAGDFQTYSPNVINGRDFIYDGTFGVFVVGSSLADVIVGSSRADPLLGGEGDDTITGGGGADAVAGGAGRDRYVYLSVSDSGGAAGFDNLYDFTSGQDTIDLRSLRPTSVSIVRSENGSSFIFAEGAGGTLVTTAAQRTVQGYDIDHAGAFGLYIQGSSVAETLIGSARRDELNGGAGDDVLVGGLGADGLFGGAGSDIFRYEAPSHSTASETDILRDFVSGVDVIDLLGVRTGIEDRYGIAQSGTSSFLFVDLGGDGVNDMVIALADATLRASDIIWGSVAGGIGPEPTVKDAGPEVLPVPDDAEFSWTGLMPLHGDRMLFLADVGPAPVRGHDWYL